MRRGACILVGAVALLSFGAPVLAGPASHEQAPSWASYLETPVTAVALCAGAGLVVFAGARSIGAIGSRAVDAIARQPEAAGGMFLAWLLTAAMIEGATLFGLVICYLTVDLVRSLITG